MDIYQPKTYKDFFDFNGEILDGNPLLYFTLTETVKDLAKNKKPVHFITTIVKDKIGRIMYVHTYEICLIYSDGFDDEMFEALCNILEFEKFKRYNFTGNKTILDKLFTHYGAEYEIIKHRIIYKCSHVSDGFYYAPGSLQPGNPLNLTQLTEMGIAFSKTYDGTERSRHEAMTTIIAGIQNNNFYQWDDDGKVCSIAQVIENEYDFPVIGHFYTDPLQQNNGYGTSVIHRLTKNLLDAGNPFCMLVADALNPASNKAFIKSGYQPTGEYMRIFKPR